MKKKGQVAIFVIIAAIIIGFFLLFLVYPKINIFTTEVNPNQFMKDCLEPELEKIMTQITAQGGSYSPTHYLLHQGKRIQYLCYTDENYKPCIVQQPLLVRKVENEIEQKIQPKARECIQQLKEEYERKGMSVSSGQGIINTSIVPGSIKVEYNGLLEITKDNKQTFSRFSITKRSEIYDLLMFATSIIEFESIYGNSETSLYLQFYPDLRIEKLKKDSDTIYTLTNVITNDKFTFATRSLVWPQGYGFTQSI